MNGLTLLLLSAFGAAAPYPLDPGDRPYEITTRSFAMPLRVDPSRRDEIDHVRIFVSEDEGRTWVPLARCSVGDRAVMFHSPRDGVYWFAVQTVLKGGGREPRFIAKLTASQKVCVNTRPRPPRTVRELEQELDELRERVRRLERALTGW